MLYFQISDVIENLQNPFFRHVNSQLHVRNLKILHRYPLNKCHPLDIISY